MSGAPAPRRTRATHAQKLKQITSQKLRRASPEDLQALSAVREHDDDHMEDEGARWGGSGVGRTSVGKGKRGQGNGKGPKDLDEPWFYHFRCGDEVWIRTAGEQWHHGVVIRQTTRKGETRLKEGLYYPVQFSSRIRKYFAPLNGEIKPNSEHTRDLLRAAGWLLDDDEDDESEASDEAAD